MLIVRSPVRISFAGGGTDLPAYYEAHGGAVLSAAINKYFYTILQKRDDGKIQVISSDLRALETWRDIEQMSTTDSDLGIPLCAVKELGCNVSVNLFLASEIPPGTGLGSSASVCVNVLKTLSTYLHLSLSKYELAEKAFHIARNVLKKPVGKQDEYAAAFGGLNYITFHRDGSTQVEPVDIGPALLGEFQSNLLLFFTGASHHSWTILHEQERSTRQSGAVVDSLHEIRELADRMKSAMLAGNIEQVGELLHQGWTAKKRVSEKISNPLIDEMYECALAHGALGGKITGAGGGGFLLLFCPEAHQSAVRDALTARGAKEMSFEFDFQGAHALVNDPFIDGDERAGLNWSLTLARDLELGSTWSAP